MGINLLDILSTFMVLFAVIDITGSIPIIIDIKEKGGKIDALMASIVSFIIMIVFLFAGTSVLGLFGVDISSFALAGAIVLFFLALEMIMGISLFKDHSKGSASIVPLAFPLIAGAGSMTTLLALRAEYDVINIVIALMLNIVIVYIVLRLTHVFQRLLGVNGILVLRKMFGIILLAISIKLFMSNLAVSIGKFFPNTLN
jgi:multiple antibiotic resistance protein